MRGHRLGILGGTFDPIHYGHLDAAAAAQSALALDAMCLIPAHDPPHRPVDPRASAFHRFALVALAIDGREGWRVSDLEVGRDGPSYSVDTLRRLHAQGWRPSQLFFILGADAFAEIATWHAFPAVLDDAHFAVVARPGTTIDAAVSRVPSLRGRMRMPGAAARPEDGTAIFLVEAPTRDVSSTEIRRRLATGASIDDLVPGGVARHIHGHALYGAHPAHPDAAVGGASLSAVDDLHGQKQRIHE